MKSLVPLLAPLMISSLYAQPEPFAKMKSRQVALSAIFSDRETFCIPQISTVFDPKGLFQQPLSISLKIRPEGE
jgi:hypothetical protein